MEWVVSYYGQDVKAAGDTLRGVMAEYLALCWWTREGLLKVEWPLANTEKLAEITQVIADDNGCVVQVTAAHEYKGDLSEARV